MLDFIVAHPEYVLSEFVVAFLIWMGAMTLDIGSYKKEHLASQQRMLLKYSDRRVAQHRTQDIAVEHNMRKGKDRRRMVHGYA